MRKHLYAGDWDLDWDRGISPLVKALNHRMCFGGNSTMYMGITMHSIISNYLMGSKNVWNHYAINSVQGMLIYQLWLMVPTRREKIQRTTRRTNFNFQSLTACLLILSRQIMHSSSLCALGQFFLCFLPLLRPSPCNSYFSNNILNIVSSVWFILIIPTTITKSQVYFCFLLPTSIFSVESTTLVPINICLRPGFK